MSEALLGPPYARDMATVAEIASEIQRQVPDVWSGSLAVYGDVFGGRVDNIHILVAAYGDDAGCLTFDFAEGERLLVWDPEGVAISDRQFRIRQASRIRWEWYSYGRSHTPDNQYVIEHVRTGGDVRASTDVPRATLQLAPTTTKPAVELLR
ncbi:hypothetical protein [Promicromonospora iranensis]|uniref:Uncharacterized protein n=1 Tax=Promicromonospora iranensis TaxID=1105144 RepID=A0ABU2CU14_9MICO|nr:hypothetical protein [Promicromonospora iranensis]MDR7384822.1 hypothetical protein [Promicromonospora iranensis]